MAPKDAQILLNGTWEHITSRGQRGLACVRKLRVLISQIIQMGLM